MKKYFKFIISIALCLSFLTVLSVGVSASDIAGDVNGDGVVSTADAVLVLRFAASQVKPTSTQFEAADMDESGVITVQDARLTLIEAMGVETDDYYINKLLEKGFPKSYVEDLLALHKKYPQWEFEPFITNLDWATAVTGERNPHKKQLIENTVTSAYKCACSSCNGVVQESGGWVSASQEAVEFYMDPRNFLTELHIFQFENNAYDPNQSIDVIESILKGTWMHNSYITYYDGLGNLKTVTIDGAKIKYSQAILDSARDSGLSAYYIAAKIVQEVGSSSASGAAGASGKSSPYNGIYNYYNIAAYTGASDGLKWANGGMKSVAKAELYKTASASGTKVVSVPSGAELYYISKSGEFYRVSVTVSGKSYTGYISADAVSLSTSYGRPWTNPYKSIYYGAKYIHESFSDYQFTGYLQKFNVNPASGNLYSHEYMANVRAAAFESEHTHDAYVDNGILEAKKVFSIPVFLNMPYGDLYKDERFVKEMPTVSCMKSTKTSLTISWTKILGASGYQVVRYNYDEAKYDYIKATTETTFTNTGLTAGTKYLYRVRAYRNNSDGTKSYSQYSSKFYATTASADAMQTGTVKVNDYLNVRSEANTSASVVTTISNGQKVNILGTSGEWYKISFNINGTTYTGYAHSDYIVIGQEKEECPYTEPTATLGQGDSGEGVKWLQWYLYKLGYLKASDIDGAFGPTTYNAVVKFQTDYSLDVDGLVGSGTRGELKKQYG